MRSASRAASEKSSFCLEVWVGESWQRAHFVSTPRKAVVTMVALAAKQPGYLGVESARGADGFGSTGV